MRFTFRQLEYFVAVGETGSITLASERINISQPSISTAVSQLETELGVQLFVRHHAQGLSLTPAGQRLLIEAKALLAQASRLYETVSEVTEAVRGQLSLGCMVPLAPMILPELCHEFMRAFPKVAIRQQERHQEKLFEGLRRVEIDLAITYDLQIPKDIEFEPLAVLPLHVLVGEQHPLAARKRITLEEIAGEPLILLDLPISREYFIAAFMARGLEPNIGARSSYPDVIRTMVANGYGYTLANVRPRSDMSLDGRRLVRLKLEGEHRAMRIGIARLGSIVRTRLLAAFENHCRSFISDGYIPGMIAPTLD